jgi:hypothetical protein
MKKEIDLYTGYLLSRSGQVSATGLSGLLNGCLSHDKISRMLSRGGYSSKELWQGVKTDVRLHESADACLIFSDTIVSKPCTDENELICRRWGHSKNRNKKGINLLTAFYYTQSQNSPAALRIPAAFECVRNTVCFSEIKTRREKRQSPVTKNEMMRSMIEQAVKNQRLESRYVLSDRQYASSDNMFFIIQIKEIFHHGYEKRSTVPVCHTGQKPGSVERFGQIAAITGTACKSLDKRPCNSGSFM